MPRLLAPAISNTQRHLKRRSDGLARSLFATSTANVGLKRRFSTGVEVSENKISLESLEKVINSTNQDPSASTPHEQVSQHTPVGSFIGISQVQQLLGLDTVGPRLKRELPNLDSKDMPFTTDAVILAVDFEGKENVGLGIRQVGLSILDTRDLRNAASLGQYVIQNRHYSFVTSDWKKRRPKFAIGTLKTVPQAELAPTLKTIFREIGSFPTLMNTQHSTSFLEHQTVNVGNHPCRRVILVGHGVHNELKDMKLLGFTPGDFANIIGIVDTQILFSQLSGARYLISLKRLTNLLGLQQKLLYLAGARPKQQYFHDAGNDAAYTLQTMLLMALKGYEKDVDGANAGWIRLAKMSAVRALFLAKTRAERNGQSADARELLNIRTLAYPHSPDAKAWAAQIHRVERISMAFLLATARWRIEGDSKIPKAILPFILKSLDVLAMGNAGHDAYSQALSAIPIYFALAATYG
ncbi:MAG: hypothetical protein Q9167_005587 [Letrouitia subvulpina]